MTKHVSIHLYLIVSLIFFSELAGQDKHHYQTDFPSEEFQERRNKIYDYIGEKAIALIQGEPSVKGFNVFRQKQYFLLPIRY